jgi:hypothetical protein
MATPLLLVILQNHPWVESVHATLEIGRRRADLGAIAN